MKILELIKGKIPFTKKIKLQKQMVVVLSVILVLTFFLYLREKEKVKRLSTASNTEIEEIVKMVGKLIILPEDLKPNVATIDDLDKLKEKESKFYENAINGDKLLIYPDRVILYSPERNIIVNIAPIVPDSNTEEGREE